MPEKIEVNQAEVQYIQSLFDNLQTHLGVVALTLIIKAIYPQYADQKEFISGLIESWKKQTKNVRGELAKCQEEDEDVARILSDVYCQGDIDFQNAVDKVGNLMEEVLLRRVLR